MRYFSCLKMFGVGVALLSSFALHAGEPPNEPVLRIDPGEHTSKIKRIATDDAGSYLVTASDDKTAKVWDLSEGRLLSTLRIPISSGNEGKLYAVALSPDGQTVALGGWTQVGDSGSSIFLFDRATGRIKLRLTGDMPGVIIHLAFSPDGYSLAATMGSGGLRLFSVSDGSLIGKDNDYGAGSYSVHFSQDGRLVTTSWDGYLRLYHWMGNTLTLLRKRAIPGGKQPSGARFSPDGTHIAVGFSDTPAVNVLDGGDLSLDYAPDTSGVDAGLSSVAWSRDGATLYATGMAQNQFKGVGQRYIRHWTKSGRGAALDYPVTSNTLMDLVSLPNGRLAFGSVVPSWGVIDSTGKRTLFHASVLANFNSLLNSFTLSSDGSRVHFGYEFPGKSPAVFDIQSHGFLSSDTPGLISPSLSTYGIDVTDWQNTTDPKLNGTPLKLAQYETSRSLALLPDGFVLGTEWKLRAFDRTGHERWNKPAPGDVWAVNASQDGRWVVAAYGDGTIRWHRASDGVEQLAFFPHADKKRWVMWTPSGYYDASPGAEELIGWHVNNGKDQAADFFPASRFHDRFYRPDVLTKLLATQDETEAVRQANEESGRRTQTTSITQVLPPVVDILSPDDGTAVSTATVTVKYFPRTADDAPVTGIRVRINGLAVTLPDERNLAVVKTNGVREVTIPIPAQDNVIQLFAENKNGVSVPATLRLTWAGRKAATEETLFKPKLYVLAVGVSKYQNPDYNLGLADKDATDFAHAFQNQEGKLYSKVSVRLLTNEKASRDEVVDGLDWLQREVTSRDVGVMFVAGHGMNDNAGTYYFLPYNTDLDKLKRTGVAQGDIQNTLNMLAGKAIFFVDTCHAGNALGTGKTRAIGGSTDAFVNELASAENGVIVFSSSTGRQLSQENPKWGNGAFTKAVVEGLNGKAEIGKSGKITHKGLDYYVTERVKELTHGQQSPVSIAPGGITDFPIAVAE